MASTRNNLARADGDAAVQSALCSLEQPRTLQIVPVLSKKISPPSMHELVVNLSRAQSLRSMADTVADYCGRTFSSSAGLIFVERDGGLQLVSQWRAKQIPKLDLAEETIRKGPVTRAFRTGEPSFGGRSACLLRAIP